MNNRNNTAPFYPGGMYYECAAFQTFTAIRALGDLPEHEDVLQELTKRLVAHFMQGAKKTETGEYAFEQPYLIYKKEGLILSKEGNCVLAPPYEPDVPQYENGDELENQWKAIHGRMKKHWATSRMTRHAMTQLQFAVTGKTPSIRKEAVGKTLKTLTKIMEKLSDESVPELIRIKLSEKMKSAINTTMPPSYGHKVTYNKIRAYLYGIDYLEDDATEQFAKVMKVTGGMSDIRIDQMAINLHRKIKTVPFISIETLIGDPSYLAVSCLVNKPGYTDKIAKLVTEKLKRDGKPALSGCKTKDAYERMLNSHIDTFAHKWMDTLCNTMDLIAIYHAINQIAAANKSFSEMAYACGMLVKDFDPDPALPIKAALAYVPDWTQIINHDYEDVELAVIAVLKEKMPEYLPQIWNKLCDHARHVKVSHPECVCPDYAKI